MHGVEVHAGTCGAQKGVSDSLELELQAVLSCPKLEEQCSELLSHLSIPPFSQNFKTESSSDFTSFLAAGKGPDSVCDQYLLS